MLASLVTRQENDIANLCMAFSMQTAGLLICRYDDLQVYPEVVMKGLKGIFADPGALKHVVGRYVEGLEKVAKELIGNGEHVQIGGSGTDPVSMGEIARAVTFVHVSEADLQEDLSDFDVCDEKQGAQ